MGRKGSFAERPVKGPGRKTKKQGPPVLTKGFKGPPSPKAEDLKLSHRQKQRSVKRQHKKLNKQTPPPKKLVQQKKLSKYDSEESVDEGSDIDEESDNEMDFKDDSSESDGENDVSGFTDDNNSWLKLKPKANQNGHIENDGADDNESGEEVLDEEEVSGDEESDNEMDEDEYDSDDVQVGTLNDFSVDEADSGTDEEEDEDDVLDGSSDDDIVEGQSEEEDDDDDEDDSENDEEDDDDDLLPIEKASKRLKIKKEKDAQLAEDELQMNEEKYDVFTLPGPDDEVDAEKAITLQDIQQRIKDVTLVLSDFKKYRQADRNRSEYVQLLRSDLCTYYSYNEFLMEKLMDIFPLNELMEFLEASEVQRPLTIRTNTLKTRRRDLAQALINRGVNLDPLGKWTKVGLVVYNASVPLGATPEYLAGHYMIQGASSMLPVMALAPQENERILDMCSAPGGKSSHIASIMKNTGVLFANDANADRIKAVVGNFHRLGVVNAVVSCEDGCKFGAIMQGFDRILLDAPCTGTGVVSKDPSVKISKSDVDIQRCYNLQRKLLLNAIDCLNAKSVSGGYLVYSTCSILPEENEWVIDYALKKRNVKLVSTGLDFGTEGFVNYRQFRFHPSMKLTRRYYPHTHNMDGFFVAKLKKFSDVIPAGGNDDDEVELDVSQEGVAVENEDSEAGKNKRKAAKELELSEAKKRKREQDEKKYVAKVFEKPVIVKKSTEDEPKKSKKNKKTIAKDVEASTESPPATQLKKEQKSDLLNGTKSKSKKSIANELAKLPGAVAVSVSPVNKSKYLAPPADLESPKTSRKNKKKQKNQQPSTDVVSSDKSIKTPKKSLPNVSNGMTEVPAKVNQKKGSPNQKKQQNVTDATIDAGNLMTPKKKLKNPKNNSPKTQGNAGHADSAVENEQQVKTPKQNRLNHEVTKMSSQTLEKTPKKPTANGVNATPQQSKTPKKQIVNDVTATPQQSKTPKKQIVNDVNNTPQQSKTPKKPTANDVTATPQQSKTPKKQIVNGTPQQSKTPKKPTANEVTATPQQSKTPKKQIVDDVKATPQQSQTPKNKNKTPGVTSKTPQQLQTPKSSKNSGKTENTTTPNPLNSSKHSISVNVPKSAKPSKQNSSPSPTGDVKQKFANQKKIAKAGKVEVDNLSDSFALKVKAKMNKKKPVKKIGNLKPNKKVDESKKKTGFKSKMEKGTKR